MHHLHKALHNPLLTLPNLDNHMYLEDFIRFV